MNKNKWKKNLQIKQKKKKSLCPPLQRAEVPLSPQDILVTDISVGSFGIHQKWGNLTVYLYIKH